MKRVFTHIGFSCAVTLVVLNIISVKSIPIITVGLTVLFAVSLALKSFRQSLTLPVCFGAALFSCLLFTCVYYSVTEPAIALSGKSAEISCYMIDLPSYQNSSYSYIVKAKSIPLDGAPQNIKLRLASSSPIIADGYQVIKAKVFFTPLGSNAFSSYGYWGDGVFINARAVNFTVTNEFIRSPLSYLLSLRNDIIETLVKNAGGNEGAVSAALVTGDKYYIEDDIITLFRLAGASHLLAVSGLHLGVIIVTLNKLFKLLPFNKRLADAVTLVFVLLFIPVAGFSGSIVRAGIMAIVMLCARLFSQKADSLNSLGIAVFIICLNPFAVSDSGAVLSTLSVLGILVIYPYLKELNKTAYGFLNSKRKKTLVPLKNIIKAGLNTVLISTSVITATLPAMYVFFDSLSFAGILSNIFVLPVGSAATVGSFLCYILSKLGFAVRLSSYILKGIISLLIEIIKRFASLKFLSVPFSYGFAFVIAAVLIIFALGIIIFNNKSVKASACITALILFISLAINSVSQYNNAEMLVTKSGAIAVEYNDKIVICNINNLSDYYSIKSFAVSRGAGVTLIIDEKESEYSYNLFNELGAKRVVSLDNRYSFNNKRVRAKSYSAEISDGFSLTYKNNGYIDISVCSRSIITGSKKGNCDFYIDGEYVYDSNGKAVLADGDIIYSMNKSGFTAWR